MTIEERARELWGKLPIIQEDYIFVIQAALEEQQREFFKQFESTTLEACPVGLFMYDNTLCLKTEYQSLYANGYHCDAYICDTGEAFWGGAKNVTERDNLIVTPVEIKTLMEK